MPVTTSINRDVLELALTAWVRAVLGLADSHVLIADQNFTPPAADYVTIRLGGLVRIGGVDGIEWSYDENGAAGQEITLSSDGPRNVTASLQAITRAPRGASSAAAWLETLQASLALPTYREPLNAVGLGVIDVGTVQNVPKVYGASTEGRATLDVRFHVVQTASEKLGYIETVEVENLTGNDEMDI